MTSLTDGLGFEEVNQSGTNTNLIQGVSGVFTSAFNADGEIESVNVEGTFGGKVEAGSGALGTGSNAWVVYNTTYSAAPIVVATDMTTAAMTMFIPVGSLSAGSFYIEGPTASDEFSFIAIGI